MSVLVMGYGVVGKALMAELSVLKPAVYDPKYAEYEVMPPGRFDVAFLCVQTPMCADGSADVSFVEKAVSAVSADVVVIKSAVPVGTAESLAAAFHKRIVVSPEFYGATRFAPACPDFLILGGDSASCAVVAGLYYRVKNSAFRIHFTDWRTAELTKYMENCFLALKVTFCNEFADIAKRFGVNYPQLRELIVCDPRFGASHSFVFDDSPYYDSHCLNKDIPALIAFAGDAAPLMRAVATINEHRKALPA
jgi:UDPglucose 6-dehydrogenase